METRARRPKLIWRHQDSEVDLAADQDSHADATDKGTMINNESASDSDDESDCGSSTIPYGYGPLKIDDKAYLDGDVAEELAKEEVAKEEVADVEVAEVHVEVAEEDVVEVDVSTVQVEVAQNIVFKKPPPPPPVRKPPPLKRSQKHFQQH